MKTSRIHLTHTKHFIGATLEFNVSIRHNPDAVVETTYVVLKQFFWSKTKAQRAFNFADTHNPYDDDNN